MMTYRVPAAFTCAFATTVSLFYLMNVLIQSDEVDLEPVESVILEWVRVPTMEPVKAGDDKPKPPPPVAKVPPKPTSSIEGGGVTPIGIGLDPILVSFNDGIHGGLSDGGHLPLVRVQPAYPRHALSRGIEGYAVVEFDINPQGLVTNPRIIESFPTEIFNSVSLRAINKFKYKPQIVNGEPVTVFSARNRFSFELSGT